MSEIILNFLDDRRRKSKNDLLFQERNMSTHFKEFLYFFPSEPAISLPEY